MTDRISASDPQALNRAADIISSGGLIVYPTDTLYGFGADATNSSAVARINRIKGRSGPISVIADSIDRVRDWSPLDRDSFESIVGYLGGAQTLILLVHRETSVPEIQGTDHTLGIRIPDDRFGPDLVSLIGRPLTTTSVNRSGQPPMNDPDDIFDIFNGEFELLVDRGKLSSSKGSSIFKYTGDRILQIR